MGNAKTRGDGGEALAAAYLELVGIRTEARNQRVAGVEVDLIARDGATHVVVEVKLRSRVDYGGAALAVDRAKRERLMRAARAMEANGAARVRIDVVAIEVEADGLSLRHYRNAVAE